MDRRHVVFQKNGKCFVINQNTARYLRMCKGIHAWAKNCEKAGLRGVMITLTYRSMSQWRPNHIRTFLLNLKKAYGKHIKGYAWVLEVQSRGAPHYHVIIIMDKVCYIAFPDKTIEVDGVRYCFWEHGTSNIVPARSIYYICSYTKKKRQKDFSRYPKGARLFALYISDNVRRIKMRFDRLPEILQNIVNNEGWESLRFWKRVFSSAAGSRYWGTYHMQGALDFCYDLNKRYGNIGT